ncbi:hypothetical protein [Streptomyces sp. B6B3]|uniref:hypothetical protein n=1 Tax=Streptomyces sp. B6B3 TaxID=3153570 RepID=UPI00325E08E8
MTVGAAFVMAASLAGAFLAGHESATDPVADDLGEGCRGTVPAAAAKTYLESDHIAVTEGPLQHPGTLRCSVTPAAITSEADEDARLDVVISPGEYGADYLDLSGIPGVTVPFGHGWVGSYAPGEAHPSVGVATLLLECPTQPGDALMVRVYGDWSREDDELAAQKDEQLAVVTARLARQAGPEWGCDGHPGEVPESLPLEEPTSDIPAAEATGTCSDVLSAETAAVLGVETVSETPAGLALVEHCGARGDEEEYDLLAYYGPSAEDTGMGQPHLAATAACGRGQGWAHYAAFTDENVDEQPERAAALTDAFAAFVTTSAQRHGCETPNGQDLETTLGTHQRQDTT